MSDNYPLARRGFGLRFVSAETEALYRAWRVEQNLSLWKTIIWISMAAWVYGALVMPLQFPADETFPEGALNQIRMVAFGLVIPFFLLGAVFIHKRWFLTSMHAFGAVGLAIVGCCLIYIEAIIFDSVIATIASALTFAAFALFMRLPPGFAMAGISPFVAATAWFAFDRAQTVELAFFDVVFSINQLGLMCIFILFISIVTEHMFRGNFINEQVIARQGRLISRYVPPSVAAQIAQGRQDTIDTPQRRRVTVLFSDIVGFTDMADRLDAESLTQILSEYMSAMADIVERRGGTLNEFAGDGLMALFGAPTEMSPEDQVLSAVIAAQDMQARLPALNEQWLKLGLTEAMQIRIGINTGVLSVGSFGSAGRMTYTAIGLQTNIAARIQAQCAPGGVLLSDASWHLVKDQIDCEARGEVECKGVHFPVKVYAPAPPPSLRGTK